MRDFPVVDLSALNGTSVARTALTHQIDAVCCDIGFLAVTGHAVPDDILQDMQAVTRAFFDLPVEKKLEVKMPYAGYPYGYAPLQAEALAQSRGNQTPPDLKETFSIGPIHLPHGEIQSDEDAFRYAPTQWPREPEAFRMIWTRYFDALAELSRVVMRAFSLALELPEDFFEDKIDRHGSAVRALNYPPLLDAPLPGQFRAGAHSDYGSPTILLPEDGSSGLEIQTADGTWLKVPPVPGAFIVNIGDLMARWTNDRWVSTMHRVVGSAEGGSRRRQSIAFFHLPNWDAPIACLPSCVAEDEDPKYPPVVSGPYLTQKFRSTVKPSREV